MNEEEVKISSDEIKLSEKNIKNIEPLLNPSQPDVEVACTVYKKNEEPSGEVWIDLDIL